VYVTVYIFVCSVALLSVEQRQTDRQMYCILQAELFGGRATEVH